MNLTIIVPAHNEEENLDKITNNLLALQKLKKWKCEIMLVDDNSTDETGRIAEKFAEKHKNITVIHRKSKMGMGNALKEATKKAKGQIIVWVMADNSDDLRSIPKMIEKLNKGHDIVFGSRYMEGGSSGDLDKSKALASSGFTIISRIVFGIKVHDITNAFRAFRKKVFLKLQIESGDFAISPEMAIKAHLRGYKLGEIPTVYSNRKAGKNKFKMFKMGMRYLSLMRYRFSY